MNPCHYPQVTRPRSRSPSPVPNANSRQGNFVHHHFHPRHPHHHHIVNPDDPDPVNGFGNDDHVQSRNSRKDSFNKSGKLNRVGSGNHLGGDLHASGQFYTGNEPLNGNGTSDSQPVLSFPTNVQANGNHDGPYNTDEVHGFWRRKCRTQSNPSLGDRDRESLIKNARAGSGSSLREASGRMPHYGSINNERQSLLNNDGGDDNDGDQAHGDSYLPDEDFQSSTPLVDKSGYTPAMVDELRKRNKLFFMDPITKLFNLHGFPWKLTFQILKVILLTAQILIFGSQRENIVEYFERSDLTYKHLLLKDWDTSYETMPYPPATGRYAIYSISDLANHINHAVEQYYQLPKRSLASIHHNINKETHEVEPTVLCYKENSDMEFLNGSYIVSGGIKQECITLEPSGEPGNYSFNIYKFLEMKNKTISFNRTISLELRVKFRTFHVNLVETHYGPSCYNIALTISYTNVDRSGQLVVDLGTTPEEIDCKGHLTDQIRKEMNDRKTNVIIVDSVVIFLCGISFALCSRSISRANKLRRITAKFFLTYRGSPFCFSNHIEYINLWYVTIMINDIVTIIGSAFKIQLESRIFSVTSENYALCSIFLGIGIFLSYLSVLRYLSFFKSYNVLILTLKTSFPHVVRFLVCAICLYTGFMFCGWVVFSPYHIKFRTLSTTSECLYSLVNGDDMFVTFSALTNNSAPIWYFHRAYLYIFISIFIYVVLSVFIAVIMDNYECLKHYYENGFPDNAIQAFIHEEGKMHKSELFSHVKHGTRCQRFLFCLFPCLACLRKDQTIDKRRPRELENFHVTI